MGIRRQLFAPEAKPREDRPVPTGDRWAIGLAAWLMPAGAMAVALLGWVATPGFPLRAVAGDTNIALRVDFPGNWAGGVNSIPAGQLTSTLSNLAPSTNVSVHGWN